MMQPKTLAGACFLSPVGSIYLMADAACLRSCSFEVPENFEPATEHPVLDPAIIELKEYFAGTRLHFDIPTWTDAGIFQTNVWKVIGEIEYGHTATYTDIARLLRLKNGARAIGRATGANPLLLFIPCHRVVGENGSLTGYAGGIERKRFLLNLELSNVNKKRPDLLF